MNAVLLDTHEVVRELKAAGFTDQQAEAVTRLVRDSLTIDLSSLATKADLASFATKIDLAEMNTDFRIKLAETKVEILKWMISSIGIQTVVIIGAVVALVRMR